MRRSSHAPESVANPTLVLRSEHVAIVDLLDALDGMAGALERGRPVPRADVDAALEAVTGFADACHHAKEEKVLFPVLRAASVEGARIARDLEADHAAARRLVAAMRAQSAAGETARVEARRRLAHDARSYTQLLRGHLEREDKRLMPLANRLPPDTRREVSEAFARLEAGEGSHARHEAAIHRLHDRWARG